MERLFRLKMIKHTGLGDSLAGGRGRGIRSESDTGTKDERLQPRFQAWTTGRMVESFTDKGAVEKNRISRKVNQHLLEAHYIQARPFSNSSVILHGRLLFGPKSNKKIRASGICVFLVCFYFMGQPGRHRYAEDASFFGGVECTGRTASVVTPPPRPSSAKYSSLALELYAREAGRNLIKMKTIKTAQKETVSPLRRLKNNNDEVQKQREFSRSTPIEAVS